MLPRSALEVLMESYAPLRKPASSSCINPSSSGNGRRSVTIVCIQSPPTERKQVCSSEYPKSGSGMHIQKSPTVMIHVY
ncbi:hypothetical protein GDO78_011910 [Eleutherodactylus coqui]|uniref:Uncharacterized protein n=1 Tax=Eleutherodactylus coqui TaxID=57060 RepID=A0A8J6K5P6_ELECQ|nr:hypothetical protein GDO78_011910 [Eleutherodactylus coqui]